MKPSHIVQMRYESINIFLFTTFQMNSQLESAISKQELELVKSLIHKGADIHANVTIQETFPWENGALDTKLPMIFHAVKKGTLEILDLLIKSGANTQQIHKKVGSTIHYAVKHRKSDMVKYLVGKGVDVNIKDSQHETPLMIAVQNENGSFVKLLLDLGAKID